MPWAALFAMPKGIAEWGRLALAALAAVLLTAPLSYCAGEHAGKVSERNAWKAKTAELAIKAEKLQRAADAWRSKAEAADKARISANRKEVDDATGNIPDQAPSARQHARACLELRRQAAAAGKPQPAC